VKIEFIRDNRLRLIVKEFLENSMHPVSRQLSVACERFTNLPLGGESFLLACKDSMSRIVLICGYHVDDLLKAINIPFIIIKNGVSPLIRGRCLLMAVNAFLEIVAEYKEYTYFATATPITSRFIEKYMCPPFRLVGVMEDYYCYNNKNEDASFYWIPSLTQHKQNIN